MGGLNRGSVFISNTCIINRKNAIEKNKKGEEVKPKEQLFYYLPIKEDSEVSRIMKSCDFNNEYCDCNVDKTCFYCVKFSENHCQTQQIRI